MADPRTSSATATPSDEIPGATIRFFISSTFTDFQTERNVLQERVFPELRQLCAASGFRLQPIDLRWGVSEAAGADRQTIRICFDELERCRALSPDFFLLILLGERYGSCFLPSELPTGLVGRLLPHLAIEERHAFETTYQLDENAVPPEYVLLRRVGPAMVEDERLRLALLRAGRAADDVAEEELFPLAASMTHREIALGLLGAPSGSDRAAGVLCALRRFAGEPRGATAEGFIERVPERAAEVRHLATAMLDRLPLAQTLRYSVDWPSPSDQDGSEASFPRFDEMALADAYLRLLRPKLEAVIATRTAARRALEARGRDAMALANAAFERERAAHIEGRESDLDRLAAYLTGETGAGLPLVVTGAAGSGKSTLLAGAVGRMVAKQPNVVSITRYIGVTPSVGGLSALLSDLRQAIARAYGLPEPEMLRDENQLVSAVATLLATLSTSLERPLVLVLDAIDQLGPHTQRSDWLPPRLAPHVRVVVSLVADRGELGYLRARLPADQIVTLSKLSLETGRAILRNQLAAAPPRTLTPHQEEAILAAFQTEGLPLYLRVAASEARRWRSFDSPQLGAAPLPKSIPDLLQVILTRLEEPERSGRALVAQSLSDLAAARYGLAEDELLDLLARDAAVREGQRELAPSSPPIDARLPLPMALWARLHAELTLFLTVREMDAGAQLLTFYHQQFRSAVETRYVVGERRMERHRALADYFAAQPWVLGPKQYNWRKLRELLTQRERTGDWALAEQTLDGLADELERLAESRASDADDPEGTVALVGVLQDRFIDGGYWRVGQRLYLRQLEAQRSRKDTVGEAVTLNSLGEMHHLKRQLEAAAGYYEQALAILRAQGDSAHAWISLNGLGQIANIQGRLDEAERYFAQALEITRAIGDRAGEATVLESFGSLTGRQGPVEGEARYYEQALAIRRALGDRAGEEHFLVSIGGWLTRRGQWEEAARHYEQALAIQREAGNRVDEGNSLNNLGNLACDHGRLEEAARYYEQALAIFRAVNAPMGEGATLHGLGDVAYGRERLEEAALYYEQALDVASATSDRDSLVAPLNSLGELFYDSGNFGEAERYFARALEIAREVGARDGEASALNNLGVLACSQGRWEEGARYWEQALAFYQAVGMLHTAEAVRRNLARIAPVLRVLRWWPFRRRGRKGR